MYPYIGPHTWCIMGYAQIVYCMVYCILHVIRCIMSDACYATREYPQDAYLPTYEKQKTGHQATLGTVYSVPNMETLKMFRVCILSSLREGFSGLNFSQFIRNAGETCFLNWNYIILVVLTVEFHITKTSRILDSPVFKNLKPQKQGQSLEKLDSWQVWRWWP